MNGAYNCTITVTVCFIFYQMIEEANVDPVYKGGSRNVATNYRPISLTSQLCKVFETIVRDQVL